MSARAYVALLRGINVGGNKPIKMDALAKAFSSLGFKRVKTLLASGNVLFEAASSDETTLAQQVRSKLRGEFKTDIGVILRPIDEIKKLVAAEPFKKIKLAPETRLYVTFFPEKPEGPAKVSPPPDKTYQILKVAGREVFSVLTLSEKTQSTDLMTFLDKGFGKNGTTRNWNTVLKMSAAGEKPE